MNTTTKKAAKKQTSYNGFAIPILPDTDLGNAMLIAEDEEGNTQPIGLAGSINEAKEIAHGDLQSRLRRLENDEDPGLCPYEYKVWARGLEGAYRLAATIGVGDL